MSRVIIPARALGLAAILVLFGLGCRAPAKVVAVKLRAPEKDVIVCNVELTSTLSPEDYLGWAEQNLGSLGGDVANPFFPVPVYEFLYSFRCGSFPLATVRFRRDDASGELEHRRTLVYHTRDEAIPHPHEPKGTP